MPLPKNEAWFRAKMYGYGWGIPRRWQGWLVLLVFFLALAGGAPLASTQPAYFAGYAVALSTGLILVCWWKGEPPRWRWGKD